MTESNEYGARDKPHLTINAFRESARYGFPSRAQSRRPLRENYAAHAEGLISQLTAALDEVPTGEADTRLPIPDLKLGRIVEVTTRPPDEGSFVNAVKVPTTLDFASQDIRTLRTQRLDRIESALLFIPDDARAFLRDRLAAYGRAPRNTRRPDIERFEVLETISAARAESIFVGDVDLGSTTAAWWELWVPGDSRRADYVSNLARSLNLDVHPDRLVFPETVVVFVHTHARALAEFTARLPGAITEVRRATGTIQPFLDRYGTGVTSSDWVDDLATRVVRPIETAGVVCTLDTGVAAAHPLLSFGLEGAWAYDEAWGADDHYPDGGHGTALAGLILYGDLEPYMNSTGPVELTHAVESMKLLPPNGFPATEPPSYGVVTQGAVAQVEVARPGVARAFCLATTTTDFPSDRPSTWSGALDQIASGSTAGDAADNSHASRTPKRLLMVATGNVSGGMLDDVVQPKPLEDPSQSWNALTIGGFTRKEQMPAPPPSYKPVVKANNRSPFSRGSRSLPYDLTPIKPEVLFEAGNMAADSSNFCGWHEAVSLLATGSEVTTEPLVPFWATSAAVGVAGNFMGRLQAALPDLWPETHRALTVDAARWPKPIRDQLIGRGDHWRGSSKRQRQMLLREVGYGVPEFERAALSASNDLTLVAEAEIQPFALGADDRSGVFNEMHFYDLPWPREALEQLENQVVTMKVTLSYFVEPNLSGKAATRPETYRSFGLRFAMKKRNETAAAFRARVNAAQERGTSPAEREQDYWLLGSKAVQAGSLHCDLWRGHAIDLAGHDLIAVYPVGGWWKSHTGQRRVTDIGRYALVISISAPGTRVDMYTEVASLVDAATVETTV